MKFEVGEILCTHVGEDVDFGPAGLLQMLH